jgi:hypothetical protein
LLSFRGIDTPSLAAQGEQRRLSLFNFRRDNSQGGRALHEGDGLPRGVPRPDSPR